MGSEMCIRDSFLVGGVAAAEAAVGPPVEEGVGFGGGGAWSDILQQVDLKKDAIQIFNFPFFVLKKERVKPLKNKSKLVD